jgi:hypothetical protein
MPIIILLYIIFTFIKCPNLDQICKIEESDDKYFDNILTLFKDFSPFYALISIILAIFSGINSALINYILNHYTPFHTVLPLIIYQFMIDFFKNLKSAVLIVVIITFIINILMTSVFLEMIELNFWGLNKNTKKNIAFRAAEDLIIDSNSDDSDEEDQNNEDVKNNKIIS